MNKFLVHHNSKTFASISNRKDHQKRDHPIWAFVFKSTNVTIYLFDNLVKKDEVKLHNGLDLVVDLNAVDIKQAEEDSKNYIEMLLNLITFSTHAYCDSSKIISVINLKNGENVEFKGFQKVFQQENISIGSLRQIDKECFSLIFDKWDKSSHQQRVMRSLSWFRKGINEDTTLDEFVAYWTGLEVIKHILRKKIKLSVKNPDEWEGLRSIFINKVGIEDFEDIKECRNELLHGHKEIGHEFVRKVSGYLEHTRNALIYSISDILNLDPKITDKLIAQGLRRSVEGVWSVIGAHLENMPTELSDILTYYPKIQGKLISEKFNIKDNKVSYSPSINYKFEGPVNVLWRKDYMVIRGDENAGIEPTFSQPQITIVKDQGGELKIEQNK